MLWNNLVRLLVLVTSLETCFCNNIAKIGQAASVSGYRTAAHTESRAMLVAVNSSTVDTKETGRIFFDAIGGWIMGSDYFPIEVNVKTDEKSGWQATRNSTFLSSSGT
jgi:hypothetical protein